MEGHRVRWSILVFRKVVRSALGFPAGQKACSPHSILGDEFSRESLVPGLLRVRQE